MNDARIGYLERRYGRYITATQAVDDGFPTDQPVNSGGGGTTIRQVVENRDAVPKNNGG